MRLTLSPLLAVAALTAVGCAGHAPSTPAPPSSGSVVGQGIIQGDRYQQTLGLWTMTIDPVALTGTASLKATRDGQNSNELYALAIDQFLTPAAFQVLGITETATTVDVEYSFTHPIPAATDIAGLPGPLNRADRGIAGLALFLADVPSATGNTYFANVVVNTALIANADAYYEPQGLITATTTATAYPSQMLVDESGADGNRVGISNGGSPFGNYGVDGWTRGNIGPSNTGWTGYGILHQGQQVTNTLSLNKAALATGPFSMDVAIIAKYNDPRFGTTGPVKRTNRLPPALPDYLLFAYREPHGALDVQRISFLGESGGYQDALVTAATLDLRIEDWDARATVSPFADLSIDSVLTRVPSGEEGTPEVNVCIPGVTGDETVFYSFNLAPNNDDQAYPPGDPGEDSGRPDDALFFSESVPSQPSGPDAAGDYTGLIRVIDPEVTGISDPNFIVELDGALTPLVTNIPQPITYQVCSVNVAAVSSGTGWAVDHGASGSDDARGVALDSLGNIYVAGSFRGSGDYGDGPVTASGDYDGLLLKLDPDGSFIWKKAIGGTGSNMEDKVYSVVCDASNNVYATGWFNTTFDFGGGLKGAAGQSNAYVVKYNSAGAYQWDRVGNSSFANGNRITLHPSGDLLITGLFSNTAPGTIDWGGGPLASAGSWDIFVARLTQGNAHVWSRRFGGTSSNPDVGYGITADAIGDVYICGTYTNNADFGGGPIPVLGNSEQYFVKLNGTTSAPIWDRQFTGGGLVEVAYTVTPAPGGNIICSGHFSGGPINFPGTSSQTSFGNTDAFVVAYNAAGTFQWINHFGSSLVTTFVRSHAVSPATGEVFMGLEIAQGANLGLGAITTQGNRDTALAKLNATGTTLQYAIPYGTPSVNSENLWALTLDAAGDPIFTPNFFFTGDFDPDPVNVVTLTSNGSSDIAVVKADAATGGF